MTMKCNESKWTVVQLKFALMVKSGSKYTQVLAWKIGQCNHNQPIGSRIEMDFKLVLELGLSDQVMPFYAIILLIRILK